DLSPGRRPFPLLHLMPDELRGIVLDFAWDLARLRALRLPVSPMPVAELTWHLDLPFWAYDGRPFAVTPWEVASDPGRYHEQFARTMAADLTFPIDVLARPSRVTILDGVHRLLKAHLLGQQTILVRSLDVDRLDEIAVPTQSG
ncbi:MAG TPA: hypothetical protein VI076_07525, partial [Actinopolymorphaceae bacterium]